MSAGSTGPEGHFGSVDQGGAGASGPWPGFDPSAPPPIAASRAIGSATTAARGDHTHEGVHSVNGLLGDVFVNGVITADSVNTTGTKLSSIAAATLTAGALAWAITVGAPFRLQQSALTVDHITVETASGKAGYQWVRVDWFNRNWAAQTTYVVDGQNTTGVASDENTGLSNAAPLLTLTELSRRLAFATIATGVAITAMLLSDCLTSDKPVWSFTVQQGAVAGVDGIFITGTPGTPIYTGSLTSPYVQQVQGSNATATDNEMTDAAIPASYTASGLVATGLIYQRTNGTALWWYPLKDLGAKTLRISDALTASGTITALVNGDTYMVSPLPKIYDQSFAGLGDDPVGRITMTFVDDRTATVPIANAAHSQAPRIYDRSTFSTVRQIYNFRLKNCACWGAVGAFGPGILRLDGGAILSGGLTIGGGCTINVSGTTHAQASPLSLNGPGHSVALWAGYDNATNPVFSVTRGYSALNNLKGKGNAGKLLRATDFDAAIGYNSSSAPPTTDASTSDPAPIQCGNTAVPGTSIATALLPLVTQIPIRMLGVVTF